MSTAHSPASSPRLPSPPPIPEDQIGPTSPGVAHFDDSVLDSGVSRRIRPGTRAEDIAEGPPLVELSELDSAFQLTEHVKALHHSYTHPAGADATVPVSAADARAFARPPPHTAREIWLYELGRFLIQKTNAIIVALFADAPPCSALTCAEMRASEWQYLCAVHDPPKSCAAIDYCCHTLDWPATTLTSSKLFPSRLGLGSGTAAPGGGGGGGPAAGDRVLQQQLKEITNIFRRVYRIYAHAWFQHREMFWRVEGKTGLYTLFKTVCDEYGMIQPENYTIPPEAEGLEPEGAAAAQTDPSQGPTSLLRRDTEEKSYADPAAGGSETTKRHRHTRSDIPTALAASIKEEAEEEEEAKRPELPHVPTAVELPQLGEVRESKAEEPAAGVVRADTLKPESKDTVQEADRTTVQAQEAEVKEESPSEEETSNAETMEEEKIKKDGDAD